MLGTAVSRLSLLLLAAGVTIPAHAALIEGTFNFRGSIGVSAGGSFDFLPFGGGEGAVVLGAGGFAGDLLGAELTLGTVKDFVATPGALNISNFITLAAFPNLAFTTNSLNAGIFGAGACGALPASGQTCTVPGSAVNFTNLTSTSSQASFVLFGTVSDGSGDDPSDFTATFTATFSDKNYQTVLATIALGQQISTSFQASVDIIPPTPNPVVPEPASVLGVGCGLAALGLLGRRYRRT